MGGWLMRLADLLVRRRGAAALAVIGLAAAAATGIPRLETEFEPERLVARQPAERATDAELARHFGPDRPTVLVLVQGTNVLSDGGLNYLHSLSRRISEAPWTGQVDSLTATPLPRLVPAPRTLEHAEARAASGDLVAVTRLVDSAPGHFPGGLGTLAEQFGDREFRTSPVGHRPTLSTEDRENLRRLARTAPAAGRLVSRNGRSALVTASLHDGVSGSYAVERLEQLVSSLPAPRDLDARVGGLPYVRVALERELRSDQLRLVVLSCLGSVLVLLIGFRSFVWSALAMASVGLILATVLGAMGHGGMPLTLLSNILPPLLVTIGLGDAVHLIVRYREERRAHAPVLAARRTLRVLAGPCFITSVTTAVGFASLVTTGTPALRELGLLAAGAVLVGYVVTTVFLPAALAFAGDRARGPRRADPPQQIESDSHEPDASPRAALRSTRWDGWLTWLVARAVKNPKTAVGLAAGSMLIAGFACRDLRVDAALLEQFDEGEEVRTITRHLERHHGGVRRFDVLLTGHEVETPAWTAHENVGALAAFDSWLEAQSLVLGVDGPTDPLVLAWSLLTRGTAPPEDAWKNDERIAALTAVLGSEGRRPHQRRSGDATAARLTVRLADAPVGEINRLLDRVALEAARRFPEFRVGLTGEVVRASRGLHQVVSDLLGSLGLAVFVIFIVMTLLFRNLRLGLLSIPPNLFPLAVVLAYMAVREIPLHAATVLVLPVTFGLAVDGTIHALCRFQEERRLRPLISAIEIAFRESGRAIFLASSTLLLGFLALAFSSFRPIRLFAELSGVAIAASLLAELTLLPALLALCRATSGGDTTAAGTGQ